MKKDRIVKEVIVFIIVSIVLIVSSVIIFRNINDENISNSEGIVDIYTRNNSFIYNEIVKVKDISKYLMESVVEDIGIVNNSDKDYIYHTVVIDNYIIDIKLYYLKGENYISISSFEKISDYNLKNIRNSFDKGDGYIIKKSEYKSKTLEILLTIFILAIIFHLGLEWCLRQYKKTK